MDNIPKIIDWLNRMGYDGDIPENLNYICTNYTSFIWDQLIENTKPRQQVDILRKNVILHRLKEKPLNQQDEFGYPIKEISLYMKKKKLEAKLRTLQASVAEKQGRVNNLSRENKLKYVFIEKTQKKIKANEERQYVLNKKSQMLESSIQETEEKLTIVGNITPVEIEENCNTKQITEVLEECAKKLEQTIKNIPLSEVQAHRTSQALYSMKKASRQQSFLEKFICRSGKRSARKHSASKLRDNTRLYKENQLKCTKKLFSDEITIEEIKPPVKRESLGLLPESCLEDDEFFSASTNILQEIDTNALSILGKTTMIQEEFPSEQTSKLSLENLCKDKFVRENVSGLLHKHNRQVIWNLFQILDDNLQMSIVNNLNFDQRKHLKLKSITQDDITKLQAIHVQTEFQTLKMNALLKYFERQVKKKKQKIESTLLASGRSSANVENVMRILDLHLEDVGLDSSLAALKKEINKAKSLEDNKDLQMIVRKLGQVKHNISNKMNSINQYLHLSQEVLTSITQTREQTTACVRKLGPFVNDMSWSRQLIQNLCSEELDVFRDFPMEYNRRFTYTDPSVYYRNICTEVLPFEEDLNTDTLYMLSDILESPFSPPEMILLNVLKCKAKVELYGRMMDFTENVETEKYTLEDLRKQESYLQFALDRLLSLNNSPSAKKSLSISDTVKKAQDIWMEMPFKNFISDQRKVDGQDFKYYEKQYDGFYNNL